MTAYNVTSTITKAGISAAIIAGASGPYVAIGGFRLGSLSALEGSIATENDTDVDGFVYQGTTSQMVYYKVSDDTIVWRIQLDPTVGDFDVGNVGIIMADGTLFAKAVLPGKSPKYRSNPPTVIGNQRFFNVVMRMSNIAGVLDVNIIQSGESSLPEVATEAALPAANGTPFNAFLVRNHTKVGRPVIAVRINSEWNFTPYHRYPLEGKNIVAGSTAMIDNTAVVGRAVYFDKVAKKFKHAEGSIYPAVGVLASTYEVLTSGVVPSTLLGVYPPLVVGTLYYANTGLNAGMLTTTAAGPPVALAVSDSDFFLMLAGSFAIEMSPTVEGLQNSALSLITMTATTYTELSTMRVREDANRIKVNRMDRDLSYIRSRLGY